MAYAQDFDYDLFISFSHDDNLARKGEIGWVEEFREELEIWLRRRGLKGLKVWWDIEQLRGNTEFDTRIKHSLAKTAMLIVLHSKNYRTSKYCHKELDWFVSQASSHPLGLTLAGNQNRRILNVLIHNINHREWTDTNHWTHHLAGMAGLSMHDADKADGFGDPINPEDRNAFRDALEPVVTAIYETLCSFPTEPHYEAERKSTDTRLAVFLADVTDSQHSFRKRMIAEIGDHAEVLAAIPPPSKYAPHDQAVQAILQQVDLSIHLLDQWPGREFDDNADSTFPQRQAELVIASDTQSLLWVPETFTPDDIEEESHKEWLNQLEQADRNGKHYQFVRESREPFVAQVLETLEALAAQRELNDSGPARFLIDTHRKDQRYAYSLAAELAKKLPNLDVVFTRDTEGAKGWSQFDKVVRDVQDLVVLFGDVSPSWVRGRIERAWKVVAGQIEKHNPMLQNIWVLLLPHCQGMPDLPRLIQVKVLDNRVSKEIEPDNLSALTTGNVEGGES